MEALVDYAQPFFARLVQTTLVAAIVICLILAAQKLLGGRLGPRWCHALWLVLPWAPPSPFSVLNLIPVLIHPAGMQHRVTIKPYEEAFPVPEAPDRREAETVPGAESTAMTETRTAARPETITETEPTAESIAPAIRSLLPALWLAGAAILAVYLFAGNSALWRIVKRERPLTRQPVLDLFEACKAQMAVETIVALVPTDQVSSALWFHPAAPAPVTTDGRDRQSE